MTKKAGKWNYKTKEYDPYTLPDGAVMYSEDLRKVVACAECGEPVEYQWTFSSMQIHNKAGFAYVVCGKCHTKEREIQSQNR